MSKIFPTSPGPYNRMANRDKFYDMANTVNIINPTIVDGGAHTGGCLKPFRKYYPKSIVHMFEPTPGLYQYLNKFVDKNTFVHRNALGSTDGTVKFNILSRPGTSSVLLPADVLSYCAKEKEIIDTIDVPCKRLDSVLNKAPDVLKLDVQGYELEVLKGCIKFISEIRFMIVEVAFIQLYKEQPTFSDIDTFLREHGFFIFNLYELYTRKNGQLTAGDAIYLNDKYYTFLQQH